MKKHKAKRIVALLFCLVMVFAAMPVSAWAAAEDEAANVIWRGAMNFNDANNQVTLTKSLPAANWTKMNWAYPLNVTDQYFEVYYAGQPVIVDDCLYATGAGNLYKINIKDGTGEVIASGVGGTSHYYDYLCYADGVLIVATENDTADKLEAFSLAGVSLGSVTGSFGRHLPVQYHDGYVICNGYIYKLEQGDGSVSFEAVGGRIGGDTFNWSNGVFLNGLFYVASDTAVYAVNLANGSVFDSYKFASDSSNEDTQGGVAYDEVTGRLFWGTYNLSTNFYSVRVNADGNLDDESFLGVDIGEQTVCTPVICGGQVYIGTQDGDICVLNADDLSGKVSYPTGGGSVKSGLICSTADDTVRVYVQSADGHLYMLADNKVTRLAQTANYTGVATPNAYEQIAMDGDGNIYCYNESGYLFSFGVSDCEIPVFVDDLDSKPVKYNPAEDGAQALTVAVAEISDGGTVSYQWESSTDKKEFTAIDGATDADYTPDISEVGTTYYRCKVTNTNGEASESVYSRTAEICVKDLSDNTEINIVLNSSNALSESGAVSAVLSGSAYNAVRADVPKNIWVGTQDGNSITGFEILQGADVTPGFTAKTDGNELNGVTYDGYYRSESFTYPLVAKIEVTAEDETTKATYHLIVTADGEYTPSVYVTIVKAGEVVMAQQELVVEDFNEDGAFTVDDALYAAHEDAYDGGAAAGYESKIIESDYGSNWGITKLWGDTSGAYGYWLNNASCWSLGDEVFAGDHLVAFVYQDQAYYSDAYAYFDQYTYTARVGQPVLTELIASAYDDSWNMIFSPFADADITAYDSAMQPLDEDTYTVINNADGTYSVTFDAIGTYYLVAKSSAASAANIVPAVCRVAVEAVSGDVYVTISDAGDIVMAQREVTVIDRNADGKLDVDEALYAAHQAAYTGGAAAGYGSYVGSYGLSLSKLWGSEGGNYGYWVNNTSCNSLGDNVTDGDHLVAFAYAVGWSDAYSKFDEFEYTAKTDSAISLELTTAGYDENWATVWNSFAGADIKAYDSNMQEVTKADYTVKDNGSGKYSVTFTEAGTYYLIAESTGDTVIVPAVCCVTVSAAGSSGGGTASPSTMTISFAMETHEETWLSPRDVTLSVGATVADAFHKVIDRNSSFSYSANSNYVRSITYKGTTLGEFDMGPNSGWKYMVNGVASSIGMDSKTLNDGDELVWYYVVDYTEDADRDEGDYSMGGGTVITADDRAAAKNVKELIAAIGTVDEDSKEAITKARAAYEALTDVQKELVPNLDELKAAEKAYAELTGEIIAPPAEGTFSDVKEHWAAEAIEYVCALGLMNGVADGEFAPDDTLSRAMLVTILYRLESEPDIKAGDLYADVAVDVWYTDAVVWASENGIVQGHAEGGFAPNDNVTREEIAAILMRYSQYKEYDVTQGGMGYREFADYDAISAWARPNVQWANAAGLIKGDENGMLNPQGAATRAEAATILMRYIRTIAE